MENDVKVILITGETGAGKSSIANQFLGDEEIFPVGNSLISTTLKTKEHTGMLRGTQIKVKIIDSCGFDGNNNGQIVFHFRSLKDFLKQAKIGIDIVLFCSEQKDRFSQTELDHLDTLMHLFGKEIAKHFFLVITKMDRLSDDKERAEAKGKYERDIPKLLNERRLSIPTIFFTGKFQNMTEDFIQEIQQILCQNLQTFVRKDLQQIKNGLEAFKNPSIAFANDTAIAQILTRLKFLHEEKIKNDEERIRLLEQFTVQRIQSKRKNGPNQELKTPKEILQFCAKTNPEILFYKILENFFFSRSSSDELTLAYLLKSELRKSADKTQRTIFRGSFEEKLKQHAENAIQQILPIKIQRILSDHLPSFTFDENFFSQTVSGELSISWWEIGGIFGSAGAGGSFFANATVAEQRLEQFLLSYLGRNTLVLGGIGDALSGALFFAIVFELLRSIFYTNEWVIDSIVKGTIETLSKNSDFGEYLKAIIVFYYEQKQVIFEEQKGFLPDKGEEKKNLGNNT